MARDNATQHRRARTIERRVARRAAYDRILIVTEGERTEVNYFTEIKQHFRLPSASVRVCPAKGTCPLQIVTFAAELCKRAPHWESVYCVFDRDQHAHYNEALRRVAELDLRHVNDEQQLIAFKAIPSNPCFELWLLLHFEQSEAHVQVKEVVQRFLRHVGGYRKGRKGMFDATRRSLDTARANARRLRERAEHRGQNPSTDVDILVQRLCALRDSNRT